MFTLALGVGGGALLGGCGSGTKTVTVSDAPTPSGADGTSSTAAPPSSSSTATSTATTPGQSGTTQSRTAPEPAFTGSGDNGSGQTALASATSVVRAHGFTPGSPSDYHSQQTLRVLVGTRTGSSDGHAQQAFFFLNGKYLGTDTSQSSASLRVVSQSDTAITLAYPLYHSHDALCCPSGGHANVRFELDNGKLTPLETIPPVSSRAALSRQ